MSIEALAMAGADYTECEINLELCIECSLRLERPPRPQYLLLEQKSTVNIDRFIMKRKSTANHSILLRPVVDGDQMKAKIREWAKTVVLSTIDIV
ncbi:hypothetical protein PanWU01x14_242770 [Parasponia andersonii]|uniref:Uncharacterized protein n=1 Tax=Parasponia andersonii TaxID=3476 RepID=A0A2P5BFW2_PARAD|nr:hypothetical protein PanWU01x14_242770 [Parasponia andersonii]